MNLGKKNVMHQVMHHVKRLAYILSLACRKGMTEWSGGGMRQSR